MGRTKSRGNWRNWSEYILSSMGCMVGLGSIWRFPYICFKNGGGAIMIPYVLFVMLTGLPSVFAELSYSQYSNLGPGRIWICCPLFKGIGYGMITVTAIVSLYYNVILAWALFYLGMSFFPTIPWSHCDGEWNTPRCFMRGEPFNETKINVSDSKNQIYTNATSEINNSLTSKTATEEFWENYVLQVSDGIDSLGVVRWQLLLCLLTAWLLTFFGLLKGIKTLGRVVYVVSILPFVFLLVLLIRGLILPGAIDGLKYYVIPRWSDLAKFSVWVDVAVQVAYSDDLGKGGLGNMASYNSFNNNCYRDAIILPIIEIITSWMAGCTIFVTLGFMAKESNVDIAEVVKDGPGLAFMAYPEALSRLPLPQLWSAMFFLMFFTFGLHSQMIHIQTVVSGILDNFPKQLNKRRTILIGVLCSIGFLSGIPCVTQGGIYLLTMVDWYCASVSIMLVAFLEITVLSWVYGADRLLSDIELMIGYKPHICWKIIWKYLTPSSILFVWFASILQHESVRYGAYQYPDVFIAFGWIIGLAPLVPIPVAMIHTIYNVDGSLIDRFKLSIKPSEEWKPATSKRSEVSTQDVIAEISYL